jgi:hypothetical protein
VESLPIGKIAFACLPSAVHLQLGVRNRCKRYKVTTFPAIYQPNTGETIAPLAQARYGGDVVDNRHNTISRQWLGGARVG